MRFTGYDGCGPVGVTRDVNGGGNVFTPGRLEMDAANELFERHRPALSAAVTRMLGRTSTDADDVLQEAWLRWRRVDHAAVADAGAYLFRLVTRLAIDELRKLPARREAYVGDDRLAALTGDAAAVAQSVDAVAQSMLVVLETLAPLERGVFLLHDVFGFSHAEIAAIVGRTERAVQQLAYRARRHIRDRRRRFRPTPGEQRAVTDRFLAAAALGADLVGYGRACAAG
jgi:RNA polymerase sigma factor (sigma-70 family)